MASVEDRVLTKILKSGSLAEALQMGLAEAHFLNVESRHVYKFVRNHWFHPSTSGTLPTIGLIRRKWPAFNVTAVNDEDEGELKALVSEIKMKSFESDVHGLAEYFTELANEDPENAVRVLRSRLQELEVRLNTTNTSPGVGVQEILSMAEEHYEGAQEGTIFGVPWPWKCLTEDTLGKRAGDFVVLYGRMKSMKTWILLYCAAFDFLNNNKRVLVWSKEMSHLKLGLRMATLLARVDYQLFKKGLLPPKMRDRCFEILGSLVKGNVKHDLRRGLSTGLRDLLLLAGKDAPRTLEGLKAKVEEFQPDVIYLDSFYHMDSERSAQQTVRWQRVATMAEDVKAYAEDVGLPIVAVHQANRLGEKTYGNTLADLADADVIAREADLIIRVLKSPNYIELHEEDYEQEFEKELLRMSRLPAPNSSMPRIKLGAGDKRAINVQLMERLREQSQSKRIGGELALVMGGNREGVLEAFTIRAVPSYNFNLITDRPDKKVIKEWMTADEKSDEIGPAKPKADRPKTSQADYAAALGKETFR